MSLSVDLTKKILLASGFVSDQDIKIAEKYAGIQNRSLLNTMLERGIVLENPVGQIIASYFKLPYVDLRTETIDVNVLHQLDEDFALEKRVAIFKKEGNIYLAALENPNDQIAKEFLKRHLGEIKWFFTLPRSIDFALDQYHRDFQKDLEEIIRQNLANGNITETPIIKIFDSILHLAATRLASDIHIEHTGSKTLVRFRVDGVLSDVLNLPSTIHEGLVSRVKILSNLRIDEHRLPQDGRFRFFHRSEDVSVRSSILPSLEGEDISLRLLYQSSRPKSLDELGLSGRNLTLVKNAINTPHGLILATGPTGSGKTTTLYNMINTLNTQRLNVITIEDPIEYTLPRVTQIQVNNQTGLTFSAGLRSILRHDPNVILVGEVRDKETADLATQAALTGHLVLSTLHTDNAVDAIPRLFDLGIEPYLISSTVTMVLSERLVRKIHQKCVSVKSMSNEDYDVICKYLGKEQAEVLKQRNFRIPFGQGCDSCNNTGFSGRLGIFEVLLINDEIKSLITEKAETEKVLATAKKNGFVDMIQDGLDKVSSGLTNLTEVFQAISNE